jgi:hypothetical protein
MCECRRKHDAIAIVSDEGALPLCSETSLQASELWSRRSLQRLHANTQEQDLVLDRIELLL